MNAETLMELAGRVEAANGPDRGLGREVLLACGQGYVSPMFRHMNPTESIDAALTLVPEGHFWSITMRGENRGGFHACCLKDGPMLWRDAATPALALTAAALKARAQEGK